jgi:hypothetical protein
MSTEMVSLLVAAGVSVVGLLTNTFISMNSTRAAQRLAILTSQQSSDDRLRDERREIYTRFLGAIDAWNRAVYPALLAAKEYAATGMAERLADMDPDAPTFPSAARPLIKAFQDLDQGGACGAAGPASAPTSGLGRPRPTHAGPHAQWLRSRGSSSRGRVPRGRLSRSRLSSSRPPPQGRPAGDRWRDSAAPPLDPMPLSLV